MIKYLLQVFIVPLLLTSPVVLAEWHNDSAEIMGTRVTVELWHQDTELAAQAIAVVMAEMRAVDQLMSPYIPTSEVFRLNQLASQKEQVVSSELFRLIDKALYFSRVSDGAFDISFASVGSLYNYRESVAPTADQIATGLPAINYQLIELNTKNQTIRFHHPQLKIDLGGIAKGFAVDVAIDLLSKKGISSAIVSAGGDSRILGDRRGNPWVIGIRHPRDKDQYAVKIPLQDTAISTSGDYERFYLQGGKRIHHILHPKTGKSATGLQSVSILTSLAVDSDALSTTVFVLGRKAGLALVNRMPDTEAVIIDKAGKLHYSDGLLRAER